MSEKPIDAENSRYIVTFLDGSKWAVPVEIIANNRIQSYVEEGEHHKTVYQETWELFQDEDEIADWAQNNMDWHDVDGQAECVLDPPPMDYEEHWANAAWEVDRVMSETWMFKEEPGIIAVNNASLDPGAKGYTAYVHESKEEEEVAGLTKVFGFPPSRIEYLAEDE